MSTTQPASLSRAALIYVSGSVRAPPAPRVFSVRKFYDSFGGTYGVAIRSFLEGVEVANWFAVIVIGSPHTVPFL